MNNKKTWDKKIWITAAAAVALVMVLSVMYMVFGPKAIQGAKTVTIEVTDDTGVTKSFETYTDAEYLRQVLEETKGLTVEGQENEYGLMIETINGVTADYNKDGAYWAVYVNGEYGSYGVDTQPVADKDIYKLEYTVDNAE